MIFTGGTTKNRKVYYQDNSFAFSFDGTGIGNDVELGLTFTGDSSYNFLYKFKSGIVYDPNGKLISTYSPGRNRIDVVCNNGASTTWVNRRLVSANDADFYLVGAGPAVSVIANNFQVNNYGSENIEADIYVSGVLPEILYSQAFTEDDITYTGYLEHISPVYFIVDSENVLDIYDCYSNTSGVSVVSFPTGIVANTSGAYVLSGAGLASGASVSLHFDTLIGEFNKSVSVFYDPPFVPVSSLSLFGAESEFRGAGSLEFSLNYYSNYSNDVSVTLEYLSGNSYESLSGSGAGVNTFNGYVTGSGYIYANLTGLADLSSLSNSSFNTKYDSLVDPLVNIAGYSPLATGQEFTGVYSEYIGLIPATGIYDGPSQGYYGRQYTGFIDATLTRIYVAGETGKHYFEYATGRMVGDGMFTAPYTSAILESIPSYYPTGTMTGGVWTWVTGNGFFSVTQNVNPFFGYGRGRVEPSYQSVAGTGTGIAIMTGTNQVSSPFGSIDPGFDRVWTYAESVEGTFYHNGALVTGTGASSVSELVYSTGNFPISFNVRAVGAWTGTLDFGSGPIGPQGWTVSGFLNNDNTDIYYPGAFTGGSNAPVPGPAILYLNERVGSFEDRINRSYPDFYYSVPVGSVSDGIVLEPGGTRFATPPDPVSLTGPGLFNSSYGEFGYSDDPPTVDYAGAYMEFLKTGVVFTGIADTPNTGINMVFNVLTGASADDTLTNFRNESMYDASFYSGESTMIDENEVYIRVDYETNNLDSSDYVVLRATDGVNTGEIYLYGQGN